ncbi:MAG: hypothetical protein DRR00_27815 [Candidatus Parabeggiatoa sp. nov. 3]|nr:MAG: hypothetical protein DRR00_27815 [Gammaproteobacteria bacterium]RKZ64554.1 MAG: hypothetical protein DRQ99_15320 [Gammaproteobacteria bacterium]
MNVIEPAILSEPWNFTALYMNFNLIGSEVENARGTFDALVERETAQEGRLSNLESAKGEFATLVEREAAQGNRLNALETELHQAQQGELSLFNTLNFYLKISEGFTTNLEANNYRLKNLGSAIEPNDAITLSQVTSMVTLGGDPSNISILNLSTTGLESGQNIVTSFDGQNIIGSQIVTINDTYQALPGEKLVVNANTSFTVLLPKNPIANITFVDFLSFLGDIDQNNITISAIDLI